MENKNNYFTYGMIKPDGMPYIKDILELIFNSGLIIMYGKIDTLNEKIIEDNYPHCVGKDFYDGMKDNLLNGYVLKMLIYDPSGNAVLNYRKILGSTKSWEADPNTIRGKFGNKTIIYKNAAHGSGNVKEANDEIIRFFKEDINDLLSAVLNCNITNNKKFKDDSIHEIINDYSKRLTNN